jgi:spore coat polysaccharide biosynthesis protein SpsF
MKKPKIIASVEARMGSGRFPGKMIADVCEIPAIGRVFERLKRCKTLDGIVLATTTAPGDKALTDVAEKMNIPFYRGSEDDVLLRVVEAHRKMNSDIIVEITGDCILLDPEVVDQGVRNYLCNSADVVCNTWKITYPQGIDVQVFAKKLLEDLEKKTTDPADREHVSLHFYEHQEVYTVFNFAAPERFTFPEYRFQLDYEEDLRFITEVYKRLLPVKEDFGLVEIMNLLEKEPNLIKINSEKKNKPVR